jgi:hypothetical protein
MSGSSDLSTDDLAGRRAAAPPEGDGAAYPDLAGDAPSDARSQERRLPDDGDDRGEAPGSRRSEGTRSDAATEVTRSETSGPTRSDATATGSDTSGGTRSGGPDTAVTLLDDDAARDFSRRWSDTQAQFVDDPRGAVRDADGLVAELMRTLAEGFATHKGGLEEQWNRGGEPSTEELRRALQQYRSFFDRLLSA